VNSRHSRVSWPMALAMAIALVGPLVSSCRPPGSSPPSATPSDASGSPGTELTGEAVEPAPTIVPIPSAGITLTWWTSEFFSPMAGGNSGEILAEQVAGFVAANPDIGLQPILKAAHGKGGILDFLSTAKAGAPSILPDVVTIDSTDLPAAVQNKLLQPLDGLLSSELREDLFPFALSVGQFEGQWYAVQFEADVEHLVYRTDKVRQAPITWEELLSGTATYIFAAAGRQELINDASIIQYLGAGGRFDPGTRTLPLDEEPLRELLAFYQQGVERGLIPAEVLTFDSVEACWPAYLSEEADMSNALASRYLGERTSVADTAFAASPTRDGRTLTTSRGWALALVATDAAHQAASVQFIEWLLAPERSAAWSQAAGRLPTRNSALDLWGSEDDYYTFLRSQLQAAVFRPSGGDSIDTSRRLQQAVRAVLSGAASLEEAISKAMVGAG